MRRFAGWGLLELMLSLALSMLLLMVLVEQLIQTKRQTMQVAQAMQEMVELQWLSDVLRSRVRMAGFTPCRRIDHLIAIDTRTHPQSLAWFEWQTQPTPQCTLRRMANSRRQVVRQINAHELVLDGPGVALHRSIMIADCVHAEVHQQTKLFAAPDGVHVLLHEPVRFTYVPPVYYAEWVSESFMIRPRAEGKPALWYKHHRADQLSQQVINFAVKVIMLGQHTWIDWRLMRDNSQWWSLVTRVRAV